MKKTSFAKRYTITEGLSHNRIFHIIYRKNIYFMLFLFKRQQYTSNASYARYRIGYYRCGRNSIYHASAAINNIIIIIIDIRINHTDTESSSVYLANSRCDSTMQCHIYLKTKIIYSNFNLQIY